MLFRQLQYFCSVVSQGSFTKAADESYVSQSAISQQIKALEQELGVELLLRKGRSFETTPAGRHLYRRGQEILNQVDQTLFETQSIGKGEPTTLRIGYLNRYEGWEVQGAVAAFALRHPHVSVEATSASHDGLYEIIMSGEVDVIFNDRRRVLSETFVNRPLMTCYGAVEVSEGSRLAWHDELSAELLADDPCILIAAEDQRDIERDYYRNVLNFKGEFLFVETLEQGRMMVAGNRGFMLVEAQDDAPRIGTVIRRIPLMTGDGRLRIDYYAFWLKARSNPLIEEFVDILEGLFTNGS